MSGKNYTGPVTGSEIAERVVETLWPVLKSALFGLAHDLLTDMEHRGIALESMAPEMKPKSALEEELGRRQHGRPSTADGILFDSDRPAAPAKPRPKLRPEEYPQEREGKT